MVSCGPKQGGVGGHPEGPAEVACGAPSTLRPAVAALLRALRGWQLPKKSVSLF